MKFIVFQKTLLLFFVTLCSATDRKVLERIRRQLDILGHKEYLQSMEAESHEPHLEMDLKEKEYEKPFNYYRPYRYMNIKQKENFGTREKFNSLEDYKSYPSLGTHNSDDVADNYKPYSVDISHEVSQPVQKYEPYSEVDVDQKEYSYPVQSYSPQSVAALYKPTESSPNYITSTIPTYAELQQYNPYNVAYNKAIMAYINNLQAYAHYYAQAKNNPKYLNGIRGYSIVPSHYLATSTTPYITPGHSYISNSGGMVPSYSAVKYVPVPFTKKITMFFKKMGDTVCNDWYKGTKHLYG